MKHKKAIPPSLGEKILKIFLPKGEGESVFGDYEELYTDIAKTQGKAKAYAWYWVQITKSIWAGITFHVWWSFTMLKCYLTVALRNLKRHKVYSLINISGLAIGGWRVASSSFYGSMTRSSMTAFMNKTKTYTVF
jgi:putative ABC transport system permease protein